MLLKESLQKHEKAKNKIKIKEEGGATQGGKGLQN